MDIKQRFSEAQTIGFLREAEAGLAVKDLCRRHGFSEACYYLWRNKFGGPEVSDARRLKALEQEMVVSRPSRAYQRQGMSPGELHLQHDARVGPQQRRTCRLVSRRW